MNPGSTSVNRNSCGSRARARARVYHYGPDDSNACSVRTVESAAAAAPYPDQEGGDDGGSTP
jgi:hypothetical protein